MFLGRFIFIMYSQTCLFSLLSYLLMELFR